MRAGYSYCRDSLRYSLNVIEFQPNQFSSPKRRKKCQNVRCSFHQPNFSSWNNSSKTRIRSSTHLYNFIQDEYVIHKSAKTTKRCSMTYSKALHSISIPSMSGTSNLRTRKQINTSSANILFLVWQEHWIKNHYPQHHHNRCKYHNKTSESSSYYKFPFYTISHL